MTMDVCCCPDCLRKNPEVSRLRSKLRRLGAAYRNRRMNHNSDVEILKRQRDALNRHAKAMYKDLVDAVQYYDIGDDDIHETLSNYLRDFPLDNNK